jgi:tetratricopeptide (TPR) repeat protein
LSKASLEAARGNDAMAGELVNRSEALLRVLAEEDAQSHARTVAKLRASQAQVLFALGDSAESERLFEESLHLYREHPSPVDRAGVLLDYAGMLIATGRQDEARRRLAEGRDLVDAFGGGKLTDSHFVLENNFGHLQQESGDLEAARSSFREALRIAKVKMDPLRVAEAEENLGRGGDRSLQVGRPDPDKRPRR